MEASERQHRYELIGSSLSQSVQYLNRRRQKIYIGIGVISTILASVWLVCFGFGLDDLRTHPRGWFGTSTSAQSPLNSEISTSGWHVPGTGNLIPPHIWQIMLPKHTNENETFVINPERLQDTASWIAMNPDALYTLVGEKGGDEFVHNNFVSQPRIIKAYDNMPNVGMKSDLLRYLLLDVEGGVYTDTDTIALKPIGDWVPEEFRDKAKVIVGIEFDRRDGGGWADISHWVQFCQWTIAAAPGHPVFRKMASRILSSLNELAEKHEMPIEQVKPSSFEVMTTTGPAAWTDVVFEQLQEFDSSLNSTQDLSFIKEPRLYGDILVLNIDGFGMGQAHSESTNDGSIPDAALAKHLFRGSWRGD